MDVEQAMNTEELRGRFLPHTRKAYQLLPAHDRPRILDIGCGSGLQTIELARLGQGEVVGFDPDEAALSRLRQRVEQAGLSSRIQVVQASMYDTGFDDAGFDILWEEGVLHLLDSSLSLPECRRLLKPDGFLVMHETLEWFDGVREKLSKYGFAFRDQHLLPKNYWWTDYGAPLEERIIEFRKTHGAAAESAELSRHESDVAWMKKAENQLDCGFFIVQAR